MIYENIKDFKNNIKQTKNILCLDMGIKKIGIAIATPPFSIAMPLSIIEREKISKDVGIINRICTEKNIGAIVIGLPLELNGSENEYCIKIRQFANKLSKKTTLPSFLQDERMSTAFADRQMRLSGVKRKKRNKVDDKIAAGFILQIVLDKLNLA